MGILFLLQHSSNKYLSSLYWVGAHCLIMAVNILPTLLLPQHSSNKYPVLTLLGRCSLFWSRQWTSCPLCSYHNTIVISTLSGLYWVGAHCFDHGSEHPVHCSYRNTISTLSRQLGRCSPFWSWQWASCPLCSYHNTISTLSRLYWVGAHHSDHGSEHPDQSW